LEPIILDPRYHDFLAILKAARNGAVYGTKVRFPHAFVYEARAISIPMQWPDADK